MAQAVTPRPAGVGPATPALASAFSMPVISPVTERPPYRYRDCKAVNILFTTDAAVLEGLVPPPLEPDLDQPTVLYIGHFLLADYDLPYNEAGLLVPVVRDGKPAGSFAVVLYLDVANPIVGGREVYGWPKKDAEKIVVEEEDGRILAEVTRYGRRIIRVTLAIQQTVDPIPERPTNPICFLKVIPSVQVDAPPDVLKLNSTVIEPDVIKELRVGKGTLEFGDSPYDPFLAKIPVRRVVYSEVIVHDFTLGYGDVLVDYLADRRE
ncbi:MAG: acetoacetate decarboxylase family protein [Candidatus Dormibacteria bacterium]|jgi:acetoacetate decarboxylase